MGDYNWSAPTRLGMEWQPISELQVLDASPAAGFAQRFKPGAVTVTAVHRYHPTVIGAAPGYALEIVDVLMPTVSTQSVFPGTDSGSLYTGFETQAGAAGTFANLVSKNSNSVATYLRNTGTLQTWEQRSITTRGGAAALSGKRIAYIAISALVQVISFTNTTDVGVESVLQLSGSKYYGPLRRVPNDTKWYSPLIGAWRLNPSTNQPWTQAQVNNLITAAGTDEFGMRVSYPRPASLDSHGFRVAGIWVDVVYATENRFGSYYDAGKVLTGWQRFAMSGATVHTANQYYWLVEYPLIGGVGNYFNVAMHQDLNVVVAASAAATTGEHRQAVACTMYNGIVSAVAPDTRTQAGVAVGSGAVGQLLGGTLFETNTGVIITQSNGYSSLARRKIATDSTANVGQQITSTLTSTTYGAISLPLAYNKLGITPDRELTIEIRHGAGSLTGGGTLDATCTIKPNDIDGTLARRQFNLNASFLAAAVQYFALIKSSAATGSAWDVVRLDTRSDVIDTATSTTVAQIEGSTIGGNTDCYAENGTTLSRYDIVIDLIAAPSAPSGFTVTAKAAVSGLFPPYFLLNWTPTVLGSSFLKYRVWVRPSRTPVAPWVVSAEIDVNTGQTAATVEANNHSFAVLDAGWTVAGGQWADGWDFALSVVNGTTGLESALSTLTGNKITPDTVSWVATSEAPWLLAPVRAVSFQDQDQDTLTAWKAMGRDLEVTRSRSELPSRAATVPWNLLVQVGEDPVRMLRAVAASGRQAALLLPSGDRAIGAFSANQITQSVGDPVTGQVTFTETSRTPKLTDFNLPCASVLNGTTQFWSVGDNALINPAGAFTIIVAAIFGNSGATRYALSKGDVTAGQGYAIRSNAVANQLDLVIRGASATATVTDAAGSAWFDGGMHVAVAASSGIAQQLYRDGGLAPVVTGAVTHGAVTNAVALVAGANNGGASAFMAATVQSWAYYPRQLTAQEAQNAAYALLGYAGYRMPGGAAAFYDARDQRCWNGLATTMQDLAGNGLVATATAAPPARGLPWPLADLEKF